MKSFYFVKTLSVFVLCLLVNQFAYAQIVITEIMYNPAESGSDSTEFIELYNNTSSDISLHNWSFTSGVTFTFPDVIIPANGYFVSGMDSVAINNRYGITTARQWTIGGLSNGGEPIVLKDQNNNTIDSLRYDDVAPWPVGTPSPDGDGPSIVLCDPNSDNAVGSNWTISTSSTSTIVNSKRAYGSPGKLDSACNVTSTTPMSCTVPGYDTLQYPLQAAWLSGSKNGLDAGFYSTKGVGSTFTKPGGAQGYGTWMDSNGVFYLFGGSYASGSWSYRNALWKWDGTTWTWLSGDSTTNASGVYGTKGVAASNNVPGARYAPGTFIDADQNLWLLGGWGYDSKGTLNYLNDLWKWDGTNWTWVSGDTIGNQYPDYGTTGVAVSSNKPGSAYSRKMSVDGNGNVWVYGGMGRYGGTSRGSGQLDELWKWDGTNWTFIKGDKGRAYGHYGVKGVANSANRPGSRAGHYQWIDCDDNLWVYGGTGRDYGSSSGPLSDLWKFDGTNWTFVSGDSITRVHPNYGTINVPSSTNSPGSRSDGLSFIDNDGNLWLMGGNSDNNRSSQARVNDLWRWSDTVWTWVGGQSNGNQNSGRFGNLGEASTDYWPGGKHYVSGEYNVKTAKLLTIGGYGREGNVSYHNVLWEISSGAFPAPKIQVLGNNTRITNGQTTTSTSDSTHLGLVPTMSTDTIRYMVVNPGTATLSFNSWPRLTITGIHAADFSFDENMISWVNAGDTAFFEIYFTPSDTGLREAIISWRTNITTPKNDTFSFAISGQAFCPVVNPTTKDVYAANSPVLLNADTVSTAKQNGFDAATTGNSSSRTFYIKNTGSTNNLNIASVTTNDLYGVFSIVGSPAATVAPGDSTSFTIEFSPVTQGNFSGTVSFSSNTCPDSIFTFAIEGVGTCDTNSATTQWTQVGSTIYETEGAGYFGREVDISEDGNRVVVGAPSAYNSSTGTSGYAQMFEYDENTSAWTALGKPATSLSIDTTGNTKRSNRDGTSVAISGNGKRMAVGGRDHRDFRKNSPDYGYMLGGVIVYEYDANQDSMVQVGQTIYGSRDSYFGWDVELSKDGNTLAIGAQRGDSLFNNSGYIRVYDYTNGKWKLRGEAISGTNSSDEFGTSVAISADGNTVAGGADYNDDNGGSSGHARIFTWSGTAWIQKGSTLVGEFSADDMGRSISLSADGNIVAVGEDEFDFNGQLGSDPGRVRIFEYKNNDWVQMGNAITGYAYYNSSGNYWTGDDVGVSVALSNTGKRVVLGAPDRYGTGVTLIYDYINGDWLQVGCELIGDENSDDFGYDVAISGNGSTIIAGNEMSSSKDSAYVKVFYYNNRIQLSLSIDSIETCVGTKDGAATATLTSGTEPFKYLWSNGDTTASADSLGAGWHYLTVVDAAQDTVSDSIQITKPSAVIARAYIDTKTSTFTSTDGVLFATAEGGNAPYTYSWSNNASGDTARNLNFGYYTAHTTDAKGCVDSIEILMDAGPTGNETYTDWRNLGADEALILNEYVSAGIEYTITRKVTNNIGEDDNFSFEHSMNGGIDSSGFIALQIEPDTAGDDANFSEIVFNLNQPIRNLRFSIGDIDASNDHGDSISVIALDANGNTVYGYFAFVGDSLQREYRGDTMTASSYGDPESNNINSAVSFLWRDSINKIIVRQYMHSRVPDAPGSQTVYISKFGFENDYQGVYDQYVAVNENNTLAYDVKADNELTYATPQTVILVGSAQNGTVNIVNGNIEYKANGNYNGIDSVRYRICDNNSQCDSAWLYISVLPTNADSMQWSLNNTDESTVADTSKVYENELYFSTSDPGSIDDGDNFTIESTSSLGLHQPNSYLTFDVNASNASDADEVVELTTDFKHPVANLHFKLIDIDGGDGSLDSIVVKAFDKNNNPVEVFFYGMGTSTISFKNADGSRTFYGIDESSSSSEDLGNVSVFIPDSVDKLVISYDPPVTADGDGNPNGQSAFISNLKWNKPLPRALVKFNNQDIPHRTTTPTVLLGTDFDTLTLGDSLTRSFTLMNTGGDTLILSQQIRIVYESSRDFEFVSLPSDTILPRDSSVFQIKFRPESYAGLHYSTLQFKSNDSDNPTYEFAVQGYAECIPMTVAHSVTTGVSCFDSTDAVVTTQIIGGAMPYTYGWSNATTNDSLIGVGAGTYYLTVRDRYRCDAKDTIIITQPNQLVATVVVDSNVTCFGEPTGRLSATATGGTGTYTYAWSGSSATNPVLRNVLAGNYTVTITDVNGCFSSDDKTVSQPALLVAGMVDGDTTVCSGTAPNKLRIAGNTAGGVGSYTYQWQMSTDSATWTDINNATSTDYQPLAVAGNTWYRRLDSDGNGCGPDTTNVLKVGVFAQPNAGFRATTACEGKQTVFTDTTTLAFGEIQSYAWSFGDQGTSNQQNPINIYKTSGTYTVTLNIVADGGCNSSTTKTVSVNEVPEVDFSATAECEGEATKFTNKSTIGAGTLSYTWDLGDNNSSTATTPNHTYTNSGYYTVQLTATSNNGCIDSVSRTVQVKQVARPNFSATAVCEGNFTQFTNLSTNVSTYSWDFADGTGGSKQANPKNKYKNSGTYTVVLTATSADGCADTAQRVVSVYTLPVARFTATEECLGEPTDFTNSSTGAASYQWVFGNGTSSNNTDPSVLYGTAGNYKVELTATTANGCKDVTSSNITVNALPDVAFTAADICLSEDLTTVNNTTGANSYAWTFGDGNSSSATAPTHTYTANGTYTVSLTATSSKSCVSSASTDVNVYAVPDVTFTATDVCFGLSTDFTNTSKIAAGTMTYVWDLGDGSTTGNPSPSYAYGKDGTYAIKLVATSNNGCKDSTTGSVDVYAMPQVNFTTASVCYGDTLFTNNLSSTASYDWSFGDGNTSTTTSPFNNYKAAGNYTIQLIATTPDNCVDSLSKNISIYSKPIADFDVKDVCDETAVQFANSSYNAVITGNAWSFGDGNTDNRVNPSNLYAAAGGYTAELIVTSNQGCADTVAKTLTVHPNPVMAFTNTTECDYDATVFTDGSSISTGTIAYTWDFGTGDASSMASPTYQYAGAGAYKVTLTGTSDKGCVKETSSIVVVNPSPKAAISAANNCEGMMSQFASLSTVDAGSLSTYAWDFGDASASADQNPTHLYGTDGTYNIELVVMTDQSCYDTATSTITIYNKPTADFNTPDICFGGRSVFVDASTDANEYLYDFGDKWGISTLGGPEYTYEAPGTYDATLFVTSVWGCRDTVTKSIEIYSLPTAQFAINNHCFGEDFTPKDNSLGDVASWSWSYDDGNTANGIDPTYTYGKDGSYAVKLEVEDDNGCVDSTRKTVVVWPLPVVGVRTDTLVSKGYTVPMLATGGVEYKWSPVDNLDRPLKANPTATVVEDVEYTVTVANEFGCTKDTFVNLRVEEDYTLEPSNIMTPDGNGQNDNWIVEKAQYYNDVEVIVFDRWGRIVYQNTSYDNTWNGVSQATGGDLPDGAYYYVVKVPAEREEYKGSITIFR